MEKKSASVYTFPPHELAVLPTPHETRFPIADSTVNNRTLPTYSAAYITDDELLFQHQVAPHFVASSSHQQQHHSQAIMHCISSVGEGLKSPSTYVIRRRKRVRHAKNPLGEPVRYCRVCGDVAINFNYGIISCESCKAFFRRNAFRFSELECNKMGGNSTGKQYCVIDRATRKNCSYCRLQKCFDLGMRREWEGKNDEEWVHFSS